MKAELQEPVIYDDSFLPSTLVSELKSVWPPESKMAAHATLMADKGRRSFRQLGEQSFSRYVAEMLCGGEAHKMDLWSWLSEDAQREQIAEMFIRECQSSPRLDASSLHRLRKWVGGNRSLLDTTKATRWALLREVATRIHALGTAGYPGVPPEEQLRRRLAPCWAWCDAQHSQAAPAHVCTPWWLCELTAGRILRGRRDVHGMDEEFYKPWAILLLLSIMVKVACAAGKLTARPLGICPITTDPLDPAGAVRSLHPCARTRMPADLSPRSLTLLWLCSLRAVCVSQACTG